MEEKKLFVAGYYDDRVFEGEHFEGKTPFDKGIDTYTLSEVLKLPFVEGVVDNYEEEHKKEWDNLTDTEKIKFILKYTDTDEIAGLLYFNSEEEAKSYKDEVIEEIEDVERHSTITQRIQNKYGFFVDVFEYKSN